MGCGVKLAGARVLVAGLGVTGQAVVAALHAAGAQTTTVSATGADLPDTVEWTSFDFTGYDYLIASPGWPPHSPLLDAAAAAHLPIHSEIELAWHLRVPRADGEYAPWLAITGTNGKTTTLGMTAAILRAGGLTVRAVGNVGDPVVAAVTDPDVDIFVVELSSFQLHYTSSLSPLAAVCLNLADDHLDWHGSFEAYRDAKARIYRNTQVACIFPESDEVIEAMVADAEVVEGALAVPFTLGTPPRQGFGVVEGMLVDRTFGLGEGPRRFEQAQVVAEQADLAHLGGPGGPAPHIVANALAAAALTRAAGVAPAEVAAGLRSFRLDEHRFATVAVLNDVAYVDDSKATNPHAAAAALTSFPPRSVVWIAGGLAKGVTFDELIKTTKDRLAGVVLIGTDPRPLTTALARHAAEVPVIIVPAGQTGVMTHAVAAAADLARPGQTVLLAPACASMDQFASYSDRGAQFVAAVQMRSQTP